MLSLPGGEGKGSKAHAIFTVTAAASPVALPAPEATIRSIEFGFHGPSTLHDGELVRFENEGFLVHMDVAAPVKNMKAAKQVVKDLLAGKEKAFEKLISGPPAGFAGPLSHEAFQQETITAKPGIYVAGLLHGHPGRAQPLPAGDGADHQDRQVVRQRASRSDGRAGGSTPARPCATT